MFYQLLYNVYVWSKIASPTRGQKSKDSKKMNKKFLRKLIVK